ncbi:MAG: acetyl-CoA carboxylase biotin carboxylase subunit, partial [Pseudonocardiaceae bacterium]
LSPVSGVGEVVEEAGRIGLPLIIKAAVGGGGRGMTVVREWREVVPSFRATRATAQATFGDSRVYLERFAEAARHVEIQVLADTHGTVVHLGERDCSIQRRHQKLIEESPALGLPPDLVRQMAEASVAGARAVNYVGAGTFEFLVYGEEFAFMEVNCRIQVEHPVTEMLTGVDLVREQLRIAAGLPLSVRPSDIAPRGAAVECRINAEDPVRNFIPTPGQLVEFVPPGGPFVRVDTHAYPGWRVPSEYDSLLAKVIAWGPDRDQALDRLDRALAELRVSGPGVHTTVELLRRVLADARFRACEHTTSFLENSLPQV